MNDRLRATLAALADKWQNDVDERGCSPYSEGIKSALAQCARELRSALAAEPETPVAWASDTKYGRGYRFAPELIEAWVTPNIPPGYVLVNRELVENFARSTDVPRFKRMAEAALAAAPSPAARDGDAGVCVWTKTDRGFWLGCHPSTFITTLGGGSTSLTGGARCFVCGKPVREAAP